MPKTERQVIGEHQTWPGEPVLFDGLGRLETLESHRSHLESPAQALDAAVWMGQEEWENLDPVLPHRERGRLQLHLPLPVPGPAELSVAVSCLTL